MPIPGAVPGRRARGPVWTARGWLRAVVSPDGGVTFRDGAWEWVNGL